MQRPLEDGAMRTLQRLKAWTVSLIVLFLFANIFIAYKNQDESFHTHFRRLVSQLNGIKQQFEKLRRLQGDLQQSIRNITLMQEKSWESQHQIVKRRIPKRQDSAINEKAKEEGRSGENFPINTAQEKTLVRSTTQSVSGKAKHAGKGSTTSQEPTGKPTTELSKIMTREPSQKPTGESAARSLKTATREPSQKQTGKPTSESKKTTIGKPSRKPTGEPSTESMKTATRKPSRKSTGEPSTESMKTTTGKPSRKPTGEPSTESMKTTTGKPSRKPTGEPSTESMKTTTGKPSRKPTGEPATRSMKTTSASQKPTRKPTSESMKIENGKPSQKPTLKSTTKLMKTRTAGMKKETFSSKENKNALTGHESTQALQQESESASAKKIRDSICQIPKVNPFSPVVMKYIKKLPKAKCNGKKYSRIEGGILKFDLKNVKGVVLISLQRKLDFWLDYSNWISFTSKTEKRKLKEAINRAGCIGTNKGNHVDDDLKISSKQCIIPHFFSFLSDGRIKIYETNKCIFVSEPKHMGKVKVEDKCSTDQSKFVLTEDGRIKHKETGLCVSVSNEGSSLKDQSIVLSNDCNSTSTKFYFIEPKEEDVKAEISVKHDCLKLMIVFSNNSLHVEFQLYAAPIDEEKLPKIVPKSSDPELKSDIAFVLFDSQSHANVRRSMPKTTSFINSNKNSLIFNSHTIVGDATAPQLTAMLTGSRIPDLPEARRGMKNSNYLDPWPFIFEELHRNGYVTLMAEDDPVIGGFHFRFWGFLKQPTTHYGRPYWLAAMGKNPSYYRPFSCIGDKTLHRINMDYLLSMYETHKHRKKFSFILSSKLVHDDINGIQHADEDILGLLQETKGNGRLNETILIILGDHGSRYGPLRESIQGKIEERLPFLSITLPDRISKEFPRFFQNIQSNADKLTSHFDIYATLRHILSYPSLPSGVKYGESLFLYLNESKRTCEQIGVPELWCPCLSFEEVDPSSKLASTIADKVIFFMNQLLNFRNSTKKMCAQLTLDKITHVGKKMPNRKVQKYHFSDSDSKCATCKIVERQKDTFKDILYEISFVTKPGGGSFEALAHDVGDGRWSIHPDISRINRYGKQASCIEKTYPHLRKYCLCI